MFSFQIFYTVYHQAHVLIVAIVYVVIGLLELVVLLIGMFKQAQLANDIVDNGSCKWKKNCFFDEYQLLVGESAQTWLENHHKTFITLTFFSGSMCTVLGIFRSRIFINIC